MKKITPEQKAEIVKRFKQSKFGKSLNDFLFKYHFVYFINALFFFEFVVYYIFGNYALTDFSTTSNPFYGIFLWHSYTHHTTDLMLFGLMYVYIGIKQRSMIYPALYVGFVIAVSEYSWWLSYIIAHWQDVLVYNQWERIYFSNQLTVLYALIIITYLIVKGSWNLRDSLFVISIWAFMLFWISIGFPITYDFNGPTIYVNNLEVNGIEVIHWIWNFSFFIILVNIKDIKRRWL